MAPKKILMTADVVGGVWNYALQLAEGSADRGVNVALATMGRIPSSSQREQIKVLPNVDLYESSYRLEWMEEPWDDLARAGRWLLRLDQQLRPDIIHLNGYAHGALPWAAPVCTVAHSCVLTWWNAVHDEPAPDCWSRYRAVVAAGIGLSDHLVAPSSTMLRMLRTVYGRLPASSVINNGISPDRFRPAEKWPMVFTAGRLWDKAKNIDAVMQCAATLPWRFVIAGEGDLPHQAAKNVSLIGKVSPDVVAHHMAIASIYCLPARYEPFGLSVLEAALSGCALVLGDIPSLRELWNGVAIFVPPDDCGLLERKLRELMEDDASRTTLGEMARQRAGSFTAKRMAASYFDLYKRLLRTGRIAAPSLASLARRLLDMSPESS
jgi:glycogen(starch) synthase